MTNQDRMPVEPDNGSGSGKRVGDAERGAALVLHEHVHRLLGVDITGEPEGVGPYMVPAAEILAGGVIPAELYERARARRTRSPAGGSPCA
jgi:hypothetical protein